MKTTTLESLSSNDPGLSAYEQRVPALRRLPAQAGEPDMKEAELAAAAFLGALGIDVNDPHVAGTPRRMASAWMEMLTPPQFAPTMFDSDQYDGLVMVTGISFASLCAHHGLPFLGTVDIGYVPAGHIVGLSKLAWAVAAHSRMLQVQEQLTTQLADWAQTALSPRGVGVRVRAEHLCMALRGPAVRGAVTTTSVVRGALATEPTLRQQWVSHLPAAA